MSNNRDVMSASISIDKDYVEMEVDKIVKAAIVDSLENDKDKLIKGAVDNTINSWVDKNTGKESKKDGWNSEPFLDWLAKKTIQETVKEAFQDVINENKQEFKDQIKKQLRSKKLQEHTAEAFLDYMLSASENAYKMPINISFESDEDD